MSLYRKRYRILVSSRKSCKWVETAKFIWWPCEKFGAHLPAAPARLSGPPVVGGQSSQRLGVQTPAKSLRARRLQVGRQQQTSSFSPCRAACFSSASISLLFPSLFEPHFASPLTLRTFSDNAASPTPSSTKAEEAAARARRAVVNKDDARAIEDTTTTSTETGSVRGAEATRTRAEAGGEECGGRPPRRMAVVPFGRA